MSSRRRILSGRPAVPARPRLAAGLAAVFAVAALTPAAPAGAAVEPVIPLRARSFDLRAVRLLDGPFKRAMQLDQAYLLGLDNDRLLHTFRITAGLPTSAKPYGGWEKPDVELRGHVTGHVLSALAFMSASTGDARFSAKAEALVAGLAECQRALGTRGYLSAFPEEFFDRVESARRVWAPYYTLHKIMAGLLDQAVIGGNAGALEVVEGMARWVKARTDRSDPVHMERVLNFTEQGGMNDVLAGLYAATGKPEYLALARRFDEKHYTEPLARGEDELKGEHANSLIPNVIGAAREYELTGDPVLGNLARYFWSQVTGARSFATGGTSDNELWETEPRRLRDELGKESHESCCTYNMLKLTRRLFGWDADPRLADFYERALWNGILSTQHPETGMMMYYVPMMPGMYRTFMTPEDSFWCCTGSGIENHAKYGDSIYFHDGDGVFVNLFISSELDWAGKGLKLRQETRFPEEPKTTLAVTAAKPVEAAIHLRIPAWIGPGGYVAINGERLREFSSPSSFLTVRRTWRTGDRIELALPMSLRMERLPDAPNVVAFLYGPIVLAGRLGGAEGLTKEKVYGPYGPSGDPAAVPALEVEGDDPAAWLKPVAGRPLTFRTDGIGRPSDVTLTPFYKLFDERYAIYWELRPPRTGVSVRKDKAAGWDGYVLDNGLARVSVAPAVGGRIIQYEVGGHEFFWVNKDLAGRAPAADGLGPGGAWLNYGGEKLWPAPQGKGGPDEWPGPPDGVLDGSPHEAEIAGPGAALRLTSRDDARSGIRFSRLVRLAPAGTRVTIDANMKNISARPRRWAIWSVAQLDAADETGRGPNRRLVAWCPMNPRSRFPPGFRVLFGPEDHPAYRPDAARSLLRVDYDYKVGKVGLDSPAGWAAVVDGRSGRVFVERFVHEAGRDYPDGASVEFWLSGVGRYRDGGRDHDMPDNLAETPLYMESELLSPLAPLGPGEEYAWHYEWAAAHIGGAFPVVAVSEAGVTSEPLAIERRGGKCALRGRFGVFAPGRVEAEILDADGRILRTFAAAPAVSPLEAVVLESAFDLPAVPPASPGPASVVLRLIDAEGRFAGELGRAKL